MIERQGAQDPVGRLGAGRRGEAAHVELDAHVGDARGLGQAGGARGEDVEGRVAGDEALAHLLAFGPDGAGSLERGDEVALVALGLAEGPQGDLLVERGAHGLERGGGFLVDDDVAGVGELDAVGQRGAGQVVVDEGGDDADLVQPVPGGRGVRAVGQEDRHRLAAPQAPRTAPVGVAVGQGVELTIGETLALEQDGRAVAPLVDRVLQVVAGQLRRVGRHRAHAVQGANQRNQEPHFAPDPAGQTHQGLPQAA